MLLQQEVQDIVESLNWIVELVQLSRQWEILDRYSQTGIQMKMGNCEVCYSMFHFFGISNKGLTRYFMSSRKEQGPWEFPPQWYDGQVQCFLSRVSGIDLLWISCRKLASLYQVFRIRSSIIGQSRSKSQPSQCDAHLHELTSQAGVTAREG